jgi:hypothetical protein
MDRDARKERSFVCLPKVYRALNDSNKDVIAPV